MNALDIARQHVGERESEGKNRSEKIDLWNRRVGVPMASPYCASFVSFCFIDAYLSGAKGKKLPPSASSQAIKRWFEKTGKLSKNAQDLKKWKGALFVWSNGDGHGHIGFVAGRLTDARGRVTAISTLEANTDGVQGDRDGDGVYILTRKVPKDRGHTLMFLDTSELAGGQWWS